MSEQNNDDINPEEVWAESFKLADQFAGILKPMLDEHLQQNPDKNGISMQIAHTNALFLLACYLNVEILEQEFLDEAFKGCKRAMIQFIKANQKGPVN